MRGILLYILILVFWAMGLLQGDLRWGYLCLGYRDWYVQTHWGFALWVLGVIFLCLYLPCALYKKWQRYRMHRYAKRGYDALAHVLFQQWDLVIKQWPGISRAFSHDPGLQQSLSIVFYQQYLSYCCERAQEKKRPRLLHAAWRCVPRTYQRMPVLQTAYRAACDQLKEALHER